MSDLAEQPLETRQALLVMATEVVRQAAQLQRAVVFKHGGATELLRSQPRDELNGLGAGRTKSGENLGRARRRIGTLFGKSGAVDGDERRIDLMQCALETHVIPIDLNVTHMADVLNRS